MIKSLGFFALSICLLTSSKGSFAEAEVSEDVTMGSSSLSAGYEGYIYGDDRGKRVPLKWGLGLGSKGLVKINLKVHDDGELALDEVRWSSFVIHKKVEVIDADIEARILGFYREELHQKLGIEMGLELIDFNIEKVFQINEGDNISYIVDANFTVDDPWYVDTNDNNEFIDNKLVGSEADSDIDLRHFRNNDYYLSYGASAKARYETQNGYMEAGAYYSSHTDREFQNDHGDNYDFSKVTKGFEVVIKPNRNNCHKYTAGLRRVEFDQHFNGANSGMTTDDQIYVNYECKIDLKDLFSRKNKDYDRAIRH